ncbi:YkvA family protein [Hathewaya histolytica]|uniref:YkvA family protein n=1 Tax=Hathewaya histolytica TaxID=1498 RepID=UPI003B68367A
MNISNVKILLSEEDLLSIFKEIIVYGKIKGLDISSVNFEGDKLNIKGTYKFKIKIPFSVKISFMYLKDNMLKLKINKVSIASLGIFTFIKNFALRKLLKDFMVIGIISYKDQVCIELDTLFTIIPYVSLILKNIDLKEDKLFVECEKLDVNIEKKYITFNEALKANEKIKNVWELNEKPEIYEEKPLNHKNKIEDGYSIIRNDIESSANNTEYKNAIKYALILPDLIALLYRLFKEPRVDRTSKIILGTVMAYIATPIDIIPNKIPFVGKIDELALVFFAFDRILNSVPQEVILQNWEGNDDIIFIIKEGVSFIKPLVGGENVDKIFSFINSGLKNI